MNAVATAGDWWNAVPGTTKPSAANAGSVGTEEPAEATASPWITFALNVLSKDGWHRPKLQARKPRGHVNFRTSLHGRRRSRLMESGMRNCKFCSPRICRPCFLYVIADRDGSGLVKVGISVRPSRRLAEHRKKTRRDLKIYHRVELRCEFAALDAEGAALRALERWRIFGDWFNCSVADAVAAVERRRRP